MAKGSKGFRGLIVAAQQADAVRSVEQLREDLNKDFKKRLKKVEKKAEDKEDSGKEILRFVSVFENWNQLGQIRQNIMSRLVSLGQLAETSGPNAGKIVIPTTFNDKAQNLLARLLDTVLGIEVDVNNGFSSLQSLDLWTILAGEIGAGSHQMSESLFSSLLLFRYLNGGLSVTPLFGSVPGIPALASQLLLPRLVTASIALVP